MASPLASLPASLPEGGAAVAAMSVPVELPACFGYHRSMPDIPDLASVAALVGDPTRARMLTLLMDGRALTATELALEGASRRPRPAVTWPDSPPRD